MDQRGSANLNPKVLTSAQRSTVATTRRPELAWQFRAGGAHLGSLGLPPCAAHRTGRNATGLVLVGAAAWLTATVPAWKVALFFLEPGKFMASSTRVRIFVGRDVRLTVRQDEFDAPDGIAR
jgi:hypothetical protein